MDEQEFRVFYAWQSDSSKKTNRNFIEAAIEAALNNIKAKGVVEASPRLDKDTKDIPGIPDIANTILEKIRLADAFVADISLVGKVSDSGSGTDKMLSNPNVMIELGYALAELGSERIVCVLNSDSGSAENLPFDLRHRRWPLECRLANSADSDTRSTQKRELTGALQSAIEAIARLPARKKEISVGERMGTLEKAISTLSGSFADLARLVGDSTAPSLAARPDANDPQFQSAQTRDALIERLNAGQFEGILAHQPSVVLSIQAALLPEDVHLFDPDQEKTLVLGLRPLYTSGWNHRVYGDCFVTFSQHNEIVDAATEIDLHAAIRAVNARLVRPRRKLSPGETTDDTLIIPSLTFEKGMIEGVARYLEVLRHLAVTGPWSVGIGLVGLKKSALGVAPNLLFDGYVSERKEILPPSIMIPPDVDLHNLQVVARAMRPAFDYVWREYNYPRSLNYSESGDWVGQ